jgi:hypothetical protein
MVVSEVAVSSGEELSPLSVYHHLLDNLRYERLVFFLGILLVEDAVFTIAESYTSEAMMDTVHTEERIIYIRYIIPYIRTKVDIRSTISYGVTLIRSREVPSPDSDVHSEFCICETSTVSDILTIAYRS